MNHVNRGGKGVSFWKAVFNYAQLVHADLPFKGLCSCLILLTLTEINSVLYAFLLQQQQQSLFLSWPHGSQTGGIAERERERYKVKEKISLVICASSGLLFPKAHKNSKLLIKSFGGGTMHVTGFSLVEITAGCVLWPACTQSPMFLTRVRVMNVLGM